MGEAVATGPVAVLLDDLHQADAETLAMLETVAAALPGSPLLLMAAYRPTEAGGELEQALAVLARRSPARLPLEGLPAPDTATLISSVYGGPVDEDIVQALGARTGGNPFYLKESAGLRRRRWPCSRWPRPWASSAPSLAQGFTSIVTLLQAVEASLKPGSEQARRHLDLALVTARENLAEARTLVTTLTPATLEAGTLGDSVHRVTGATGAQAGIEAHAEVTGTARRLPTGTEVVLLRVCQEALANVRKHAAAQRIRVGLCYTGTTVRLTVTDDGKGFDPAAVNGGYGLKGMRDRVSQVGGTVEVTSAPGDGTEVRAEVPG